MSHSEEYDAQELWDSIVDDLYEINAGSTDPDLADKIGSRLIILGGKLLEGEPGPAPFRVVEGAA